MKNSDNEMPEDSKISELKTDEKGDYRMVDGKKIYQIKEESQKDKDINLAINRVRASGMSPSEYLRSMYE